MRAIGLCTLAATATLLGACNPSQGGGQGTTVVHDRTIVEPERTVIVREPGDHHPPGPPPPDRRDPNERERH